MKTTVPQALWSAAAATALEYRRVNSHFQIASRSHSGEGGSFAAALQNACGDHCGGDIFAGTGYRASQVATPLISSAGIVTPTFAGQHRPTSRSARLHCKVVNPCFFGKHNGPNDRGRESVIGAPPPSEPDRRISRIRLSSWWFYLRED